MASGRQEGRTCYEGAKSKKKSKKDLRMEGANRVNWSAYRTWHNEGPHTPDDGGPG